MDQYEVIPEAPVLSLNDAAKVPPRKRDPIADGFGIDEARIIESSPAFDPGKRDPNSFRMAGKHIVDATLNVLLDNPATHLRAIGREYEEDQDPIRKRMEDNLGIPNRRKKIAEKLTALGVAIRDTLDMSPEEMTPRNFFEQVLSGVGGAIPSIGASAAGAMTGGGLATVAKSAPGIVKTAQLAGAGIASFSMEKPVLEKELLDAGFEGGFSDRMSSFYALPVAMLDAVSFGYLTGVLKPIASEAVSTTVGRSMFRRALQFEASATGQVVVKAAEEGATEAIQGQIQSEFENRLGLQNPDFQRDFSSRVVEFVVGALMGGSFGAAHLGGQLEARSQAIDHLVKVSGQSKSEVAKMYDAATLEAIDRTLDDLSKDRGDAVSAQVAERVKWIQQAIDKSMGREGVNTPDKVEANNQKLVNQAQIRLNDLQKTIEDSGIPATPKQQAHIKRLETRISRLSGKIALGGNIVSTDELSNIRNTFAAGRRYQIKDIGQVHEAFRRMLRGTKLSLKATKGVLKSVLSIKTGEEFNAKQGQIIEAIDTVVNAEKVETFRDLASDILSDMSDAKARNVGAKTQVLAKKLSQILSGDIPVSPRLTGKVSTAQIMEQALEEQMASLNSNETDVNAALYAVTALKDFYSGELETRLMQIERIRQDDEKLAQQIIAGLKGGKVNRRKASVDAVRERLKSTGAYQFLFPSTYLESFLTIANDIDAGQGKPHMEGAMVKNFDPAAAYRAWMTLTHQTREAIDFKLAEIYGPKYLETLTLNRTANFIDVEFVDENGAIEKVNISKASAMSLYMMQRNPAIRQQLIDIGYNETWLDNLAKGDVFSRQDHQWMTQVDQILKDYGKKIAPLYERLTGKPFRLVDQYFMTQRYMFAEEGKVSDNTPSVVRDMIDGVYDTEDITGDPRFKMRTKSAKDFVIPDITQAVTRYSSDMNHFLAYAEYAVKLKALLDNKDFMSRIEAEKSKGLTVVLNNFLDNLIDGSDSRASDRAVMSSQFRALGWLARNKIASPRSGFMQFTALAGFTDPTASTPVNSLELAQAALDLPSAIKSGELKNLTETGYMRERWLGAFDQAAHLSEEMSRSAVFSKVGKFDPKGILRKLGTNKTLHEWMTISTRFGDRAPSVVGGWAVYRKVLGQTGDKVKAVDAAIKMIEEVNGSLDPGKSAEIYGRSDFVSTLFKLFTRSTSIYLDRYLRLHKSGISGRIPRDQYIKGLALYHVWIPIFTSSVAMGAGAGFDDDELKTMMLAGPFSYHLFIGALFKTVAAGVLQATGFNEKFAAGYEQGGDLLDGVSRDLKAAYSKIRSFTEYPDFESMWAAVAYSGKALDFLPLPMGYLSRQPEALMKILQGDWPQGLMEVLGYSSAATKVE